MAPLTFKMQSILRKLRWLKTVSSTKILMGCYSHSLSLDATIMVSKNCPTIGERHLRNFFLTLPKVVPNHT